MQMTMDPELKQLMQQVNEKLAEQSKIRAAVLQLEEQMKGLPRTIEHKIEAVRRTAWDAGGNYRGVFGSEAAARGFGLLVMATVGRSREAASALKAEFRDVYDHALGDTPESGANVVPVEYSSRIQRLVEEFGQFAAGAFNMPMSESSLTFWRRTKGMTIFKSKKPGTTDQSTLEWESVNLNAEDWHGLVIYPKSLGEDMAAPIGEVIALEVADGFAEQIDKSGFLGDGTPTDLDVVGITTRLIDINGVDDGGGLVLGTGSAGAKWSGLVRDDFLKMIGRARFVRDGAFYCDQAFYWEVVAPIILAAGGVTAAEMQGRLQLQAFGQPVRLTPVMPRTAGDSQVPILYGDLRRSSTLGSRRQLMIEQSAEALFIERQVAVLATQRLDINNHSLGDATDAGPMVGLITPAA